MMVRNGAAKMNNTSAQSAIRSTVEEPNRGDQPSAVSNRVLGLFIMPPGVG
jgi:hypothetical protein